MNIIVFGGAGFLGSHVCDAFSDAGHMVTVADVRKSPWLSGEQRMCLIDMCDEEAVSAAVMNADIVCNFAGIAHIELANNKPVASVQNTVLGNIILLEACRKAKVQRYIFASSLYVHGISGGLYRCSKQACELYIEQYRRAHGLAATIVRYGSLYGVRANMHNALHRFVRQALTGQDIIYPGSATAVREYVYVEDAARLTVELLQERFAGTNILISGAQRMQVAELFTMLSEILGKKLHITFMEDTEDAHYLQTPYSFIPKAGKKLTPSLSTDLGQGLLELLHEVHAQICLENDNLSGNKEYAEKIEHNLPAR